ncbi:MAG: efflux RND transporter periplasmic adaptor subunit [Planctomycetes bacterium]|nr:efflux RND transporter periplasmic adaptor subunit [Planctomycetota bacterium]
MTELPRPRRFVALGILFALPALAGCGPRADAGAGDAKTAAAPPLVRTELLALRKVRRTVETTSYLESMHQVTVQSRVSGRVLEVLVDEGQKVKAGEVLARLDTREPAAELRQAEVQLADRRVRHDLAKLTAETSARRLEAARIERDKQKAQLERNQAIDPALIPPKDLEDSQFAYQAAEEGCRIAELESRRAEVEIGAAANAIAEFESRVESQKLRLAEHAIVSPIDGVVSERGIRGGETISPTASTASSATPLFVVTDADNLICYLRRPQRELPMIQGSKQVTFTTDAVPEHEFHATIDFISPIVDTASGAFAVRVRVVRDDSLVGLLRPGMFVRARILAEDEREALMVPKAAVLNEGAVAVVFVVRDGIARRVVVDAGLEEREHVEARNLGADGLSPGDAVITSGQHGLQDKTAVEVSTS